MASEAALVGRTDPTEPGTVVEEREQLLKAWHQTCPRWNLGFSGLADFGVARKLLFVRNLSCSIERGSNSVGRMPASQNGYRL